MTSQRLADRNLDRIGPGEGHSLIDHLRYLCPHRSLQSCPRWPPDVFALAGFSAVEFRSLPKCNVGVATHAVLESENRKNRRRVAASVESRQSSAPTVVSLWRQVLQFNWVRPGRRITGLVERHSVRVALHSRRSQNGEIESPGTGHSATRAEVGSPSQEVRNSGGRSDLREQSWTPARLK